MSKKELLNEAQIRRFMTLANLQPLVKNVVSETKEVNEMSMPTPPSAPSVATPTMEADPTPEDMGDMGMEEPAGEPDGDEGGGGGLSEKAIDLLQQLVAELSGEQVEIKSDDEASDEEAPEAPESAEDEEGEEEEMDEAKMPEEEEMDEAKKKKAKKEEEEEEEMDENVALSEDSLVEAVLARVTARLVAEAKKAKEKKMTPKQKAEMKKKEMEKKKKLAEATSAEGGGPLLKQGKNKYDVYKGHADMAYAKGKEGKGGHQLETVSAKAEHTVTHGGKNLATLGGNKKKV